MNNKIINLGIIGTGNSAKAHIKAFRSISGARIAGIAGRDYEKAGIAAKQYGIEWCAASAKELIESPEIDALVIAVPPFIQPELAVSAFENGKHVLCEKPLAVTVREAERIVDAWRLSGRTGMINFCYRLIPQILEFKARIAAGDCGHVHSMHAEWILSSRLNPSLTFHWKGQKELGGGVLQNYGIHVLDYMFYDVTDIELLGAKQDVFIPVRSDEKGDRHKSTGDEVTTALFSIGKKTSAAIHLSLVTMPPVGHRIIARGSKGTLEARNLEPDSQGGPFSLWFYKENDRSGECLSEGEATCHDISVLFSRVAKQFIEAIRSSDKNGELSLECGLKATRLVDRIQRVSGFSV